MTLSDKIELAVGRIREAYEEFGWNETYVALSGGKDSLAILKLTEMVVERPIVVHNGHAGESIGNIRGVLCVKEPKATMVPIFLQTVGLRCQIDGTRKDEDDMVRFDGEQIHRSKMPSWQTSNGVFGLHTIFPLCDWTEDDVFQFLEWDAESIAEYQAAR